MGPTLHKPVRASARTLFALWFGLQLLAAAAQAHFLWVGIGSGAQPPLRVTFAEGPDEPTSSTLLPKLAAARARDAAGRPVALSSGSGARTAALASGTGAAAAVEHWGVVERDGAVFLLEYYAKAAESIEQAGVDVKLPLEIFARRSGSGIVALIRRSGVALPQASIRLHLPSGQTVDKTGDASGEITFEAGAPGIYGLRARWVEDRKGAEGGKAYTEVRHYTTLTFGVTAAGTSGAPAASVSSSPKRADPTAYALLKAAHDSRQVMPQDFPGFRCRLLLQEGDTSFEGTLVYRRRGTTEVTLDGADKDSLDWIRSQLLNLAGHRRGGDFAQGDGKYPLELGPEDHNRYGRLVLVHDDFLSSYRVKDNKVLEVTRTMEGSRFTISVIETMEADAGKYLANHFLVSYRDASTGALQKVEGYRDGYARVDGVWLPTSRTVLTSGAETSPRIRTIRLRAAERLDPPN